MKKKKFALLALVGLMALTTACGGKKEETKETETASNEEFPNSSITKLGEYKGIEVEADTTVTDEEVQATVDQLLEANPLYVPVEGKTVVEEGDLVNIDYVGKLDGEEFQGGSSGGQGFNLLIGSDSFIDGFEDGLIGKEVGGTYDLDLNFPDPYPNNPDLAGKAVVFTVEVHNIVEEKEAEWNDDFVKENTQYETVDAYMEGTRASLEDSKKQKALEDKEYNVVKAIIDGSEFNCAEEDIASLKEQMKQEYQGYASYAGLEFADFLMYYMGGMTEEQFDTQLQSLAEFQLQSRLTIQAIAEAEKITLSDEEYKEGVEKLSSEAGYPDVATMEEQIGKENLVKGLTYDKTIDFVVAEAVEK